MTEDSTITRRNALKALGGAAAVGAVGAGAILATGSATAASVSISGTTVETDDGDLSFVDLHLDDYFGIWDGFDIPAAAVAFRDRVSVGGGPWHTLYDQRGDDANPVLLENISSKDSGGDGWGGPGEYASTSDTKTAPDTSVIKEPTGPATAGWVHADVDWRVLSDDLASHPALSVETPAVIGDDVTEMDNPDDGTTDTYTVELEKRVYFYRTLLDSESQTDRDLVSDDGSTSLVLMGGDDGTEPYAEATPAFPVDVVNQPSSDSTTGDGNTTSG